jgi:hypothetical protein
MRVTAAGGEIARTRKEGRDGPDEHQKKLAGPPQEYGAIERLASIGGLSAALELGSTPR